MAEGIEYPFEAPEDSKSAQSIGPPTGWKPEQGGLEAELYGKHHTAWAMMKVAEEIFPFGKIASESGRAELGAMETGEQAGYLGVNAAALALPYMGKHVTRWAGTGLKSAYRAMRPLREPLQMELLDQVLPKIKTPNFPTPKELLVRKYGLSEVEAQAWDSGQLDYYFRRSGGTPSENLKKLIDFKALNTKQKIEFTRGVRDELKTAARPIRVQEEEWLAKEWDKQTAKLLGIPQSLNPENRDKILKYVTKDLFGEELAANVTSENATSQLYANMLLRYMGAPYAAELGKLGRTGAGSVLPTMIQPTRVIFGSGDELFKTYRIYEAGVEADQLAKQSSFVSIGRLNTIYHSKGLGKLKVTATNEVKFTLDKAFKDSYYKAGPAVAKLKALIETRAPKAELDTFYRGLDDGTRKFVDAYTEWSDEQYKTYLRQKVTQIFDENKITTQAWTKMKELLDNEQTGVMARLKEVFSPAADLAPYFKDLNVHNEMDRVVKLTKDLINDKQILSDSELILKRLASYDSKQNPGGMINYTDSFIRATGAKHSVKDRLFQKELSTRRTAKFFVPGGGEAAPMDLAQTVENRARKQARELFFYPGIKPILEYAKEIPDAYREYTGHWIFRMLGKPTPTDAKVADWLQSSYGSVERMLGLKSGGLWNAERVLNLSYNINNLIYLGGLGFKPFSALRNFFQPFTLVPTDLGGAKDFGWFFKGIYTASRPEFRAFMNNELKAIQEYAPELHLAARAARPKTLGVLGDIQQIRDMGMFMFQMSDRWSRYTTGGAAFEKWNHYLGKYRLPNGGVAPEFAKKMNIQGRYKWISTRIEDFLRQGGEANLNEARNLFIKDVIADTQYLYSAADSPQITNLYGAPGRLAVTFQSWWMNYATLLEKWVRTGDAGTKANRLFGGIFSMALAEQIMEPVWGRGIAKSTVGMGPFPSEINEFQIPPTYAPMYRMLAGMIKIGQLDFDAAQRHGEGFLRSATMFAPGGLQLQSSIKGAINEGWPGLAKSIIRYQKNTDYEPLWGLLK